MSAGSSTPSLPTPPYPPADIARRTLPIRETEPGTRLYRIHRAALEPLHFGRDPDPARRRRWDAPNASYGVCYVAEEDHIAFAETLLRDLSLEAVHEEDLHARSLALIEARVPLRLVEMTGRHLRRIGADASVVHGSYELTWTWSAALHAHPQRPDGIRYRTRHGDSGFAAALFERARRRVRHLGSTPLSDPTLTADLARWLDRYEIGLTR